MWNAHVHTLAIGKRMGRKAGDQFEEQWLRRMLQDMTRRWKFYQVVRDELKRRGNWKDKPRGKPYSGRYDQR